MNNALSKSVLVILQNGRPFFAYQIPKSPNRTRQLPSVELIWSCQKCMRLFESHSRIQSGAYTFEQHVLRLLQSGRDSFKLDLKSGLYQRRGLLPKSVNREGTVV